MFCLLFDVKHCVLRALFEFQRWLLVLLVFLCSFELLHASIEIVGDSDSCFISKEELVDPRFNNTDVRFTVQTTNESDIREQEIELLREFANMPKTMVVIICNNHNVDFMMEKITQHAQNLIPTMRHYNNIPMILNERAASLLPKLNERNEKLSAFTVLMITLNGFRNRLVFMKDNKLYAQNVAGMTEDEDFNGVESRDIVLRNTACRELWEEVRLSVEKEKVLPIALFKFMTEKRLIKTRWTNVFAAFYCYLNRNETDEWLNSIGMSDINDEMVCDCRKVVGKDETQWLFFVKPELFEGRDFWFSLEDKKIVSLPSLHSDVAAAVIQRVLHQDVLIGRGNRHLDGEVTYSNVDEMFAGCFDHLAKEGN